MSENLRKRIQRRRALAIKKGRAVSPVVATLILILVAVAAAAALYLWLVAWQGNVTSTVGNQGVQATITIGGSTSVYPFEQAAAAQFTQNQTDIAISVNQGGTGAGMLAVCHNSVDIGASSSLQTVAGLQSTDGCPATTVINTIAFDAVDIIVANANPHGLVSVSWDTLTAVYDGASTSSPTLLAPSLNGAVVTAVPYGVAPWSTHAALTWSEIPAAVAGATVTGCPTPTETISTVAATPGANTGAACAAPNANDFFTAAGTSSSCGWTICAGGTIAFPGTDAIKTVARSDASGTTQTFEARLLGATSATAFASTFGGLGFSGCGSNNVLSDCGMSTTLVGNGNPGVIAQVAGSQDAIGYASDGLARASTSGVTCAGVATGLCGIGFESPGQIAALQPSLGSSGTIAAGIILGGFGLQGKTTTATSGYAGARPFEWVTTNTPSGEVEQLLQWVLDPANNLNVAADTGEVSIYST